MSDNVLPPPRRRRRVTTLIPSLILGVLGILGIAALRALNPDLQVIDLAMLLVVVAVVAWSWAQGILRGLMAGVSLYIATGIAATFYRPISPYVGAFQQAFRGHLGASTVEVDNGTLALSFCLLASVIWGVLGIFDRLAFRDTSLPALGILDKLGGMLIYLVVGILVASLLFNAFGYGGGRSVHDAAQLRPQLNQVLYLHYLTQSFWFPRRPPPLYVYDLRI